jgi:hypothetical protein
MLISRIWPIYTDSVMKCKETQRLKVFKQKEDCINLYANANMTLCICLVLGMHMAEENVLFQN